jgi:hypothetical protein
MAVTQRVIDCKGKKVRAFYSGTLLTAADVDKIVTTTNMKVGAYSVAAQPTTPSKITVSATASGTADTMGTVTIVGTNFLDQVISEVIIPIAGSIISGTKYFKTVTSATGAGWIIDAGNGQDTITIGVLMSSGIECFGKAVSLYIVTGNVWANWKQTAVADTTSIPMIAGDSIEHLVVSDNLNLISDGSGGTYYAIVWDRI